ncbi:hypothetical protein ACFL6I_16970 [candidate division KSB1 bacterium]
MKIELNIEKKHVAIIIAAMLLISALTFMGVVTAQAMPTIPDFDGTQPFHKVLYVSFLKGMSTIVFLDDVEILGSLDVQDDLNVGGDLDVEGEIMMNVAVDYNDCHHTNTARDSWRNCEPDYVVVSIWIDSGGDGDTDRVASKCCRLKIVPD